VLEKVPLLLLVVGAAAVTLETQAGALRSLESHPLTVRAANAIVSYVTYLWEAVWPRSLGILYAHPGASLPWWLVTGCLAFLIAVTLAVVASRRTRPYLLVGWLWYLGTLVPVIGLVQAGEQAMADRFTYVPLVGIFLAAAWILPPGRVTTIGVLMALATLAVRTRAQIGVWRDSITLYEHALALNPRNATVHANLGAVLIERGEPARAKPHLQACIDETDACPEGRQNLATILLDEGRADEAIVLLEQALALRPDLADAHYNLGNALVRLGRDREAIERFRTALRHDPEAVAAAFNLGNALARVGAVAQAVEAYRQALALQPGFAGAHHNLANAFMRLGDFPSAVRHYEEALRLDPSLVQARDGMQSAVRAMGGG
jgi:Tfp pilus assembly protein PilF